MQTDDEIIAVVSAHKEGKKIECRKPDGLWFEAFPFWDFSEYEYRVTTDPRELLEWDAWYLPESKGLTGACMERHQDAGWRPIKVREVATSGEPTVISSTMKTSTTTVPRKHREWWIDFKHAHNAEVYSHNFCGDCIHVVEVLDEATSGFQDGDGITMTAFPQTNKRP